MTIYAQWHGGHSYACPTVEDTEEFPSLQHAKEEFGARICNADGRTPCVEGSHMWIYYQDPRKHGNDDYPDMVYNQRADDTVAVLRT